VVIDCQRDVAAVERGPRDDRVENMAERVADERLPSGPAGQRLVGRELEPSEARGVDPRRTEHLSGDPVLGAVAPLLRVAPDPPGVQALKPLGASRGPPALDRYRPVRP